MNESLRQSSADKVWVTNSAHPLTTLLSGPFLGKANFNGLVVEQAGLDKGATPGAHRKLFDDPNILTRRFKMNQSSTGCESSPAVVSPEGSYHPTVFPELSVPGVLFSLAECM